MDIEIVIAVNKRDLWFCRICVASIRYYYPDIKIHLIKDELNGKFSTKEIEAYWNVQLIDYPVKRFGWSAAKMHFYCDKRFAGRKFLVLDADIVFVGKLLDQDFIRQFKNDVIVSVEQAVDPRSSWFSETYFDYEKIKAFDSAYEYQGYSFNCGQLFCNGNFLDAKVVAPYFDFKSSPAWKRLDIFPLVDQSVLNYLIPKLSRDGRISVDKKNFMLWSEEKKVQRLSIESIKTGENQKLLIHWAGAFKSPYLKKVTRGDILAFFEEYYYRQVPCSALLYRKRQISAFLTYNSNVVSAKVKNIIKTILR